MTRLIDADALKKWTDEHYDFEEFAVGYFVKIIQDMPTVDAEPVRHGRWIPVEDDDMFCYCSECGTHEYRETIEVLRYDFCPYCGAKMDDAERKEE